jgi:uncharacterized protein (DUF58 family)
MVPFYPSRRAILLMAAGAPLALGLAMAAPGMWAAAGAWMVLVAGLMIADVMLAPSPRRVALEIAAPGVLGVGRPAAARLSARFPGAAPRGLELAAGGDARLVVSPERIRVGREAATDLILTPQRRGAGRIEAIWARWTGPLGLVWLQKRQPGPDVAITPDITGVKDQALRLFTRDASLGAKPLLETGEGSDFHALKDFTTGMDLGDIDWKSSARRLKLIGREHHTERNHHLVLALDTGRLMSAPSGGLPRIDRAIHAALLLAFVSLKLGDRVGLFAFDARPRLASGMTAGPSAFPLLQRLAAGIDYSTEETNFTLGLTALAGRLDRRAMVVVFTDFADPTSAELMVENLGHLTGTHLVLFVAFRDAELEAMVEREPAETDDVSRAVIAGELLRQREAVVTRLKRLGVQIVDAPADGLSMALLNGYLDAKRRGRI